MLASFSPLPPPLSPVNLPTLVQSAVLIGAVPSSAVTASMPDASVGSNPLPGFVEAADMARNDAQAVQASPVSFMGGAGYMPLDSSLPQIRFSSQFLTQLLSQSSPEDGATIGRFFSLEDSPPTSILDSRVIRLFGQVKYRPSNAGKPAPVPVAFPTFRPRETRSPVTTAVSNGNRAATAASNDNRPVAAVMANITLARNPSIRSRGMQAYAATGARNDALLTPRSAALSSALSAVLGKALSGLTLPPAPLPGTTPSADSGAGFSFPDAVASAS